MQTYFSLWVVGCLLLLLFKGKSPSKVSVCLLSLTLQGRADAPRLGLLPLGQRDVSVSNQSWQEGRGDSFSLIPGSLPGLHVHRTGLGKTNLPGWHLPGAGQTPPRSPPRRWCEGTFQGAQSCRGGLERRPRNPPLELQAMLTPTSGGRQ